VDFLLLLACAMFLILSIHPRISPSNSKRSQRVYLGQVLTHSCLLPAFSFYEPDVYSLYVNIIRLPKAIIITLSNPLYCITLQEEKLLVTSDSWFIYLFTVKDIGLNHPTKAFTTFKVY
jgi:hypothetical protein